MAVLKPFHVVQSFAVVGQKPALASLVSSVCAFFLEKFIGTDVAHTASERFTATEA